MTPLFEKWIIDNVKLECFHTASGCVWILPSDCRRRFVHLQHFTKVSCPRINPGIKQGKLLKLE